MKEGPYCLAKDSFDYYVYGNTKDVMIFVGANKNLKWDFSFYLEKEEIIEAVKNINRKRSTTIMNLL